MQPTEFFYENAGVSYHPAKETMEEGRQRGTRELAAAELWADEHGYDFDWRMDPDTDSSDFSDEEPPWTLWECLMRDFDGELVQSLHGIDFGRDRDPWMDDYKRVVEAELALEQQKTMEKETTA